MIENNLYWCKNELIWRLILTKKNYSTELQEYSNLKWSKVDYQVKLT